MLFNHTKYLEAQIEELKKEKRELQARNDKLVEALVPILRKMGEPPITAGQILENKKTHTMTKKGDKASCSCGWSEICSDPGKLQELISQHYTENTVRLATRRSWPQIRSIIESKSQEGG